MTRYTTLIEAAALRTLLAESSVVVFDCSFDLLDPAAGRRAFVEGHIPGAAYLHLDDHLSSAPTGTNGRHPLPNIGKFASLMRNKGVHQGQQVVTYDRSGGPYAARLWWLLRWLGHKEVAVLDGGLEAWTEAGGETRGGNEQVTSVGDFTPHPREHATVTAQDLVDALGSDRFTVIDARSPERFAGLPHPFDPVAGHIPGARNRFFMHNLDDQRRWKPREVLAEEFASVTQGSAASTFVLQCGSGVTACHNALAMAHAGLGEALLYAGSWSEWITDRERPIER